MADVYMMKVDTATNAQYHKLLSVTGDRKKKEVQNYKFRLDAVRSLAGEIMVRHILSQTCDMSEKEIHFVKNAYGKPFIKGCPNVHFNISHAGKWVVCAFDSHPIGIDIEKKEQIDLHIADRFFANAEADALYAQHETAQLDFFFRLWTLKESYIKMIGRGLFIPLDSFSCDIMPNSCAFIKGEGHSIEAYLRWYDLDAGYKLAICQGKDRNPLAVYELSLNKLLGVQ